MHSSEAPTSTGAERNWVVLNYGFRIFFLLGAGYAVVAAAAWLVALRRGPWPGAPADLVAWHAHEMLFGVLGAVIAGFLLTAVPSFTGRAPVQGPRLGLLAGAWLAGRLAMALHGAIGPLAAALLDLLFPVLLAGQITLDVVASRNRRNLVLAAILVLLAAIDAGSHLALAGAMPAARAALDAAGPHTVAVLVTLIGGRIIPSFTANWMRARSMAPLPVVRVPVEVAVVLLTVAAGVLDSVGAGAVPTGSVMLVAALAHGLRLQGWRGSATLGEPLIAAMHLGYAWLALGYLALGVATLADGVPRSGALHVLTVGALGTMVLAVMPRVALGHTGRELTAPATMLPAWGLVGVAAIARFLAPVFPGAYSALVDLSAACWIAAFALFLARFWPVLTRPRADVKPARAG